MNQFVKDIKDAFDEKGLELEEFSDWVIGVAFSGDKGEPLRFRFVDHEDNSCSLLIFKEIDINEYDRTDLLETVNKLNMTTCIMGATVMLWEEEEEEPDIRAVISETFAYGATKRILDAYDNLVYVALEIDRIF